MKSSSLLVVERATTAPRGKKGQGGDENDEVFGTAAKLI